MAQQSSSTATLVRPTTYQWVTPEIPAAAYDEFTSVYLAQVPGAVYDADADIWTLTSPDGRTHLLAGSGR